MPRCSMCGAPAQLGLLCDAHAQGIGACRDITAEQVVSREIEAPAGWLVDQWGRMHPLASPTVLGRSPEHATLPVLHHSVSAVHAELDREASGWRITDRGSLNGTLVNGRRVRAARLEEWDRIQLGEVCFYVASRLRRAATSPRDLAGGTVPTPSRAIAFAASLARDGVTLELQQRAGGGIVRVEDRVLELARLEFALLQHLVEARQLTDAPDLGYLTSRELATHLDFHSREADGDNVRELVRRVRRKLAGIGVERLIESRQGVGYRVSWDPR